MALQPISNNMDELSQAEKVVAVLIDNQLISGLDAINVLKEIWNNDKKEKPITTLLPDIPVAPQRKNPLEIKDPINAPWEPYNPPKIWYQADHTGEKYPELPTQYSVKENANITTIATNDGGASSITWQEWDRNHLRAENPLNESKVFNRID